MDRDAIERLLPHREPFLMVDQVLEIEPLSRAVGLKEVRADEDWARGHFPGNPIFPGVLIAEALAQVAALAHLASADDPSKVGVYLAGIDKLRVRRMVRPGDTLRLEVQMTRQRRSLWFFDGAATLTDGTRVADGAFLAAVESLSDD